jgi:hypothetical protein
MQRLYLAAFIAILASGAATAQPAPAKHTPVARSTTAPIDKGPYTADANRAYQGGGVILQGAPGAPAPMPEPTPPGQAPRNAVAP